MTWEVVKIIGNLFNDSSSKNSRDKTTSNRTNKNPISASNNQQQKLPSPNPNNPKSQKIPSSPIIHPIPILRTPSSSSTIRTVASSQFSVVNDDNDDVITQQLAEENELLYLQLPEDVKCILDKLRILQRSEKSIIFDQQLPTSEWQSPFATLEAAMMSILLLTPSLLLTSPPKTPLKDDDNMNNYFINSPKKSVSSRRGSTSAESFSHVQENFQINHSSVNHNFYKNHNNSSRSSHISSITFHSDFSSKSIAASTSTITKKSSLCKVLSASSLLTCIVRTILSMHNETLITYLINRDMLDYYNSLTDHISEDSEIILTQVHKINSLVRYEEIASHSQSIYDKLITHSNRLVDSINLFVNFVHKHLPVICEEPLEMQSTNANEGQNNKKKKNTFGKKVIKSLTSFKRRSITSINQLLPSDSSEDNASDNYHDRFGYRNSGHSSTFSFEIDPQRTRLRNDSVGSRSINSVESTASMPVNYSRSRKSPLSEAPKPRKLHLSNLSRENRHDIPVPISPMKSNSRFKEQLENPSSKPSILLGKGRRRLSDVSGAFPLRNSNNSHTIATRSFTSLVDSGFKNNNVNVSSTSRSRRSSNSSIKSYLIKQVHSLSSKGKSQTADSTSKTYNYWPVTEDVTSYPDLFVPHSQKSFNQSFKTLSSGKRHKLQKTSSETELRNLKKLWSDTDNFSNGRGNPILHNLSPHVEDDGENFIEHLSAANVTAEGTDGCNNNLREQLFRKLVTKKSSNSLNIKKKSYPSNLIKIPHVFTRSNEEGNSVNPEVSQNMEDVKSFSNKGLEVNNDGLIIELVDGSPQILAGTLDKLLFRLIDEEEKDAEFIDYFLFNHIFFISSELLLQEMVKRYRIFNSQNDAELDFQQQAIHKNIISILYRWVTIQPQDFQINVTLRDSMRTFLTDEVTKEEFQSEVSRIKTILEVQSLISMDRQKKSQSIASSSNNNNKNFENIPRSILSDSSPLLEFESKNIAKYLTLIDFAVLKSMTFFDITVWWRKRKALESGGSSNTVLDGENRSISLIESHLDAFIRRSNMISHWIAHEICSLKTVKARRTILHKFIETARYCREYNNFHVASCIALALNSRPVQRLVKTWESLSHQDIMTSQSIEELIDPSRNMRKYRKSLANAKPPVIPFFAIFLKDLTFIIEGNPTYLRNKQYIPSTPSTPTMIPSYPESRESSIPNTPTTPSFSHSSKISINSLNSQPSISTTQEPLINFEKFRFLAKNIRNIKLYTSESYSFINQLSRPPKILTSNFSIISPFSDQNDLISTYNSLINNNLNGNGYNNIFNNGGNGSKPAPLDHIGEVIERRMFAAAGSIFGDNVTSIAMLDGNELEAELMTLSLEAEPANVI